MEKASSAEDLLQMCLAALESEGGEAGVRERLGLPPQDDKDGNGKKKDAGAVQKALLQVLGPHAAHNSKSSCRACQQEFLDL